MTLLICIDAEYGPDAFWNAFRTQDPGDPALRELRRKVLTTTVNHVQAPADQAETLMAWAATLPAWGDGPEHAPNPMYTAADDWPEPLPNPNPAG